MRKKVSHKREKKSPEKANFINFNKCIYQKRAILKSIADFDELADFDLKEKKEYFVLIIKQKFFSSKNFLDEFSNYVLGLMEK